MKEIAVWDYNKSVEKMLSLVVRWKTVTVEMLGELYRAREALSKHGPRSEIVSNETNTWTGYLQDIGLHRATAHRWLSQYDPQTHTIKELEPPSDPEPELIESPEVEEGEDEDFPFEEIEKDEEPESSGGADEEKPSHAHHKDESEPDIIISAIKDYIDCMMEELGTQSAKHMVINEMIKYFRQLSIRFNQEA